MPGAAYGDTVLVDYIGRLKNGDVFSSSQKARPLRFTLGQGEVIPGFEQAVIGLEPGQMCTTEIESQNAFGPRRPDLVWEVPLERLPASVKPKAGEYLTLRDKNEQDRVAAVKKVTPETVVLDANHPLAGEDVIFDIKLVAVD
jgi:peptidylprolyl isomerase